MSSPDQSGADHGWVRQQRASHVFIVGMSRTGTTLLRDMLNESPDVRIGGETFFLPSRRRLGLVRRSGFADIAMPQGSARTQRDADRAVEAVYADTAPPFWRKVASRVDRDEFARRFASTDRHARDLLDIALSGFADGRPVRGEKTPAHVHSVPTLLTWFPDAKIIHMLRDPRAVYVSNLRKYQGDRLPRISRLVRRAKLPFELYASLNVLLEWRRVMQLHANYTRRYGDRYLALRYEDLVREPEQAARTACHHIGVAYTANMLDRRVVNSSFLERGARGGFDSDAVERWRTHLHPVVAAWIRLWAGSALGRAGYEP